MEFVLDFREKALSQALSCAHKLQNLPVGDVTCTYYADGTAWVAERKTVQDLSASIRSGRLREQTSRLHAAGFTKGIIWIVEGAIEEGSGVPVASLWGAILNMELRPRSHMIRCSDVNETAQVLIQLGQKLEGAPPGIPTGLAPPSPLTKRKKDAGKKTVAIRQLTCIPSISENIAKTLIEQFGSVAALQRALSDKKNFPKVTLTARNSLGKKRLEHLRDYLCD